MAVNHHYPIEVGNYLNINGAHWPNISMNDYTANESWHIQTEGNPAVDLGTLNNNSVGALAAVDGTLVHHPNASGYGPFAFWIQGDDGLQYFYGHCAALLVHNGAKVKAGDKVAIVGSLGNSSGNHIHFGVAPAVWPTADGGYGYGYPTGRTAQFLFDTAHGNKVTAFDPNNPASVPPQKVPVTPPPPPPTFIQKTNKMLLAVPFAIEAKQGGQNAFWIHVNEKDVSLSNGAIVASVMSETYGKPFDELVAYNLFGQVIQSKAAKNGSKLAPGIKLPFRVTIEFKKTSDWSLVTSNVGNILKEMITQTFHYDPNNNQLFPTLYADQQKWTQQTPRVIGSTSTGDFPSWKPIWVNSNLWTENTAPVATKKITLKPELWYGQPGGPGGVNGGTSSSPTGIINSRDKFIEMARGRGFKKSLIYALVNNVETESSFKSDVIEGGGLANPGTDFHNWPDNTGLGLFQFSNQVARDYFAKYNYDGKAILDGGNQLDYVFNVELMKPRYAILKAEIDKYQSGTTENYELAVKLCSLWTNVFEVPQDNPGQPTQAMTRCNNKEDVYKNIK